jgi:hypothetical protein
VAGAKCAETPAVGEAGSLQQGLQGVHETEFGVAVGQGNRHGVGLLALAVWQGEPDAAVGLFQVREADRREFRLPQRAGKGDQQEGAVAETAQVAWDRRQQPAHDFFRCRDLLPRELAFAGGVALDAGRRLGDADIVRRHRAAGSAVQVADRGAAQF